MSYKGELREVSEKHLFDPEAFKAGVFSVGAEYEASLAEKGALASSLREISEAHDFDPSDFQAGAFSVGAQYKGVLEEK